MTSITSKLPPASQNNARGIVRALLDRFHKKPSEILAQKIEALTGEYADYSEKDQDFFEPANKEN